MTRAFLSKDEVLCDMLWCHPDAIKIHSETLTEDKEYDSPYISYDLYQYPEDQICKKEGLEPAFIVTLRGPIDPRLYVYRKRSKAFRRLEKEKEKFDQDTSTARTLTTIGRVARR